ncbi:MAG TPA: chemotaxis protein, partial [Sphingomonas sp.]
MSPEQMPPAESVSKTIDLAERLRVFDLGPAEMELARELWSVVEPDAREISAVHWHQRQRLFGSNRNWAPHEVDRMIDLGVAYQRNRFVDMAGSAWVQSAERTVAGAYAADVELTTILSMSDAGARATFDTLCKRLDPAGEQFARLTNLLFRLRSLECDVYCTLFTAYYRHSESVERDRLTVEFRDNIGATVETTWKDSGKLREQGARASALARGMLGKSSEVAAAAEQSAVAMREAAQTAAGLIRA